MDDKLVCHVNDGIAFDVQIVEGKDLTRLVENLSIEIERLQRPHRQKFDRAVEMEEAHNLEGAIRAHEEILQQDANYFASLYCIARLYDDVGRYDDSVNACERAAACPISEILLYEVQSVQFLAKKHQGDYLAEKGLFAKAISQYDLTQKFFVDNLRDNKKSLLNTAIVNLTHYAQIHVRRGNLRTKKTPVEKADYELAQREFENGLTVYSSALEILTKIGLEDHVRQQAALNIISNVECIAEHQKYITASIAAFDFKERQLQSRKKVLN